MIPFDDAIDDLGNRAQVRVFAIADGGFDGFRAATPEPFFQTGKIVFRQTYVHRPDLLHLRRRTDYHTQTESESVFDLAGFGKFVQESARIIALSEVIGDCEA